VRWPGCCSSCSTVGTCCWRGGRCLVSHAQLHAPAAWRQSNGSSGTRSRARS
jgi:hypothetical protein